MSEYCLKKDRLRDFVAALCADYRVVAPVEQDGKAAFQAVGPADLIALGAAISSVPPKTFVFPQCEKLMTFDGSHLRHPDIQAPKTVLLGLHPCDCRSFLIQDRVFTGKPFADPYYSSRRENTLLVALACSQPASTCFCTEMGGSPASPLGADILLVDAGEMYVVQHGSERGQALVKYFSSAPPDMPDVDGILQTALAQLPPPLEPMELAQALKDMFESDFWQQASEKCLGCGACAYLCPTCHCFDISDETVGGVQTRYRTWDTCNFPLFTQEASGFNPRKQQAQRLRQRILHKFSYFPSTYGLAACVGCGRCVRACPVNLDIRAMLAQIRTREAIFK